MSLIHKTVNVQDFTFKLDNDRGSVEMLCISPDNLWIYEILLVSICI